MDGGGNKNAKERPRDKIEGLDSSLGAMLAIGGVR